MPGLEGGDPNFFGLSAAVHDAMSSISSAEARAKCNILVQFNTPGFRVARTLSP